MKNKKFLTIVLLLIIILLTVNKMLVLNVYKSNDDLIDTKIIFDKTIKVESTRDIIDNKLTVEELSIYNYFKDYKETEGNSPIKYKTDKKSSFYSIVSIERFIDVLKNNKLNLYKEKNNIKRTKKSMTKYLDKNNINNDIDLLKHIKENYYFNTSIFDSIDTIRTKYALNLFIESSFPNPKEIILIEGNLDGFIVDSGDIKIVFILYNDKVFQIVLCGEEINSIDFIRDLLETVHFNLN